MAQIKASDRRAKITAALAGVAVLCALLAWGGYRAVKWWNAPSGADSTVAVAPLPDNGKADPPDPEPEETPMPVRPASKSETSLLNAVAMTSAESGPPASPTVTDIAMHPSWKYHKVVPIAAVAAAPSMRNVALPAPVVLFGGAGAKETEVAPTAPRAAPADPEKDNQSLIDANLKMEDDRKFVMSLCRDLRGCLWVGTEDGGIQRFDPSAPELHQ